MSGVVFIYAREDVFEAQQLAQRLEQATYPVEMRVSLGYGPESFKEQIYSLIGSATAVIVLWSFFAVQNPVIRDYAGIAAEKGKLVSVLSYNLPWPSVVEGKPPVSRYEHYAIPKSEAASLFPPWLTMESYPGPVPAPAPALHPPLPNIMWWEAGGSLSDVVLLALPGVVIVGSFLWGLSRGSLSVELVGWAVLSGALVNLLRGLRR